MSDLAPYLDFANHHANATPEDIEKLCRDVVDHGFHAAFVNPAYVSFARGRLAKLGREKTVLGTVISFPLGQDTTAIKMAAANNAVAQGADELDVVPNIGLYLSEDLSGFQRDLTEVVDSARMSGASVIVKFILDPGYFDGLKDGKEQFMRAAEIVRMAGADFVKIGSGMGPRNPTVEDVKMVRKAIGKTMKIKVAGGVKDAKTAQLFIDAGADRIGTSSAIEIVSGKSPERTSKRPSHGAE